MIYRIACLSDQHGNLPKVPECDLLLIAGDICPVGEAPIQRLWLQHAFDTWLKSLVGRMDVVGVSGNHDWVFQHYGHRAAPNLKWTYLEDSETLWKGLKIYGSPHQPIFFNWAFNLPEPELAEKWAAIPDDTDILLLHGPPHGVGDFSPHGKVHTGSPSLLQRIEQVQPKLAVFGHIHSGYGQYRVGNTLAVNASLVNENYTPVNPIQVVEVEI